MWRSLSRPQRIRAYMLPDWTAVMSLPDCRIGGARAADDHTLIQKYFSITVTVALGRVLLPGIEIFIRKYNYTIAHLAMLLILFTRQEKWALTTRNNTTSHTTSWLIFHILHCRRTFNPGIATIQK